MRLFVLPEPFFLNEELTIKEKDFVYLTKVLRLKENSSFPGKDKNGKIYDVTITHIFKDSCSVKISEKPEDKTYKENLPSFRPKKKIILFQCMPKGHKINDIVRMATESGVSEIVLVDSKNCISKQEEKAEEKVNKLTATAKEAQQQSGSVINTRIHGILKIQDVPSYLKTLDPNALGIVFHQSPVQQTKFLKEADPSRQTYGILIGSEGGLTNEEVSFLEQEGFICCTLKTNILRCETAAIYAIGALQTLIE